MKREGPSWTPPGQDARMQAIEENNRERRQGEYTFTQEEFDAHWKILAILQKDLSALNLAGIRQPVVRAWSIDLVNFQVPQTDKDGNSHEFRTIADFALYLGGLRHWYKSSSQRK